MRDQKTRGKSQDRQVQSRQRKTDALSVTATPSASGQLTRGTGKRQLTRADDERVYYTTLRQPTANKNSRNKPARAGSNRKRSTMNGATTNRKNSRGQR